MPSMSFQELSLEDVSHGVLFVGDIETLKGAAAEVDQRAQGRLTQALQDAKFSADFGTVQTFYGLSPFSRLVIVGTGKESLNAAQLQDLGGYAVSELPATAKPRAHIAVDGLNTDVENPAAHIAFGAALRDYHFDKYKKAANKTEPRNLVLMGAEPKQQQLAYDRDLRFLAEGVYLARDMSWEPGKSIYPQAFVDRVRPLFKGVSNVKVKVLNLRDMQRLNMGALMGVGQGSVHDPALLIVEYRGAGKNDAPVALVGKGITFDTGGTSLKKNDGMWAMKSDLSGAAAVAGTLLSVAKRGAEVNVVGLMPLAENMPSGDAIRPGDVLQTMQGTTIEIISTDAEGRLILADAVRYAQDTYKPKMLLNIATLTGSAVRALSDEYAALVTRDWELTEQMMDVGRLSGEAVWPLPLHPNHFKQLKSDIADIKNSGVGSPGASIGAAVVGTFVDEDLPWVHLDIAGVDWLKSPTAVVPTGAQGWGVRFMDKLLRQP